MEIEENNIMKADESINNQCNQIIVQEMEQNNTIKTESDDNIEYKSNETTTQGVEENVAGIKMEIDENNTIKPDEIIEIQSSEIVSVMAQDSDEGNITQNDDNIKNEANGITTEIEENAIVMEMETEENDGDKLEVADKTENLANDIVISQEIQDNNKAQADENIEIPTSENMSIEIPPEIKENDTMKSEEKIECQENGATTQEIAEDNIVNVDENIEKQSNEIKAEEKKSEPAVVFQKTNALSMLANYSDSEDSESGSEDEEKGPNYRNQSGTEDSESSSSSSSSESEEEMDLNTIKSKVKTAIADSDEDDDDDEGCNNRNKFRKGPLKVKGEMLLSDLPPIEDLQISVDEKECLEIGKISSIVEQLVLVEAYQNTTPLDIDSILFLEKGKKALGYIFDVIGQVSSPMYCVRFNSNEDIIAKSISVDDKVFCAPRTEYIKIVILPNIMSKGSDASWKNDIEPPPRCQEFSDDEEERHVKRQSKISNSENREFIRGRRHLPQQQLAYPNYSWHQNIPQQNPQQNPQYQFPNYNYWNNN